MASLQTVISTATTGAMPSLQNGSGRSFGAVSTSPAFDSLRSPNGNLFSRKTFFSGERVVSVVAFTQQSSVRRAKRSFLTRAAQAVDVKPRVSPDLVETCINAIRILIVDSVNNAGAGHPGAAMGLAPVGFVVWDEAMRYNPTNPNWFNRDRFVLSVGHASLLQYTLLHLTGFDMQMDDLKNLCQFGSRTPGHPENLVTPGIEVVTGALGQGFANSVGLAIAEKHLAARFNKPDMEVVDHYTFCIMGDGCAMEGVTNEAASLAGHLGLDKLITFYDSNRNTIDGGTGLAFTEDVGARYAALGWHVQTIPLSKYGNVDAIRAAVTNAKRDKDRPSFIVVETVIGYGSPAKEGTPAAHHGAFGEEEGAAIRRHLNWKHDEKFFVPPEVYKETRKQLVRGAEAEEDWKRLCAEYKTKYPKEGGEFEMILSKELPKGWEKALPVWKSDDEPDATRGYSEVVLNALAKVVPGMLGGSADLATSNKVYLGFSDDFERGTPGGRNIRYGIREHGMASISNGIACHNSGLIPFAATFLIFTDYARAGIRLAALNHAQVIWIGTHDSIALGEDGPTHQPIEHLASLRAMPNLFMLRPGDGNEVSGAYHVALSRRSGPTLLALSRQKLDAQLEGSSIEKTLKGGYVLTDNAEGGKLDLILLGTGAELVLCQQAAVKLREEGMKVRLVSMVCWELFEEQSEEYREEVLPPSVTARLSVEAASTQGWREWIGPKGQAMGINRFGASGPYKELFKAFGFTLEKVIENAKNVVASQ